MLTGMAVTQPNEIFQFCIPTSRQGCEINWKKGKNVTVKTIKKKQKHKSRGSVRTVTKSVQADSFFNFFSPPAMPEDPNSTLASDIQVIKTNNIVLELHLIYNLNNLLLQSILVNAGL